MAMNAGRKLWTKPRRLALEDMIVDEDMIVMMTHGGYIKRNPVTLYRSQLRRGKGVTGIIAKEEDFVEHLFVASTHSYILVFTDRGKVYWLKVYEIPGSRTAGQRQGDCEPDSDGSGRKRVGHSAGQRV